jgi:hypothetical protein
MRRPPYKDGDYRAASRQPRRYLFERPLGIFKVVLNFLDLPYWDLEASEIIPRKRNEGEYELGMDPATRRRLEEYFEPHN